MLDGFIGEKSQSRQLRIDGRVLATLIKIPSSSCHSVIALHLGLVMRLLVSHSLLTIQAQTSL